MGPGRGLPPPLPSPHLPSAPPQDHPEPSPPLDPPGGAGAAGALLEVQGGGRYRGSLGCQWDPRGVAGALHSPCPTGGDIIAAILAHLPPPGRTRRQVMKQLVRMGLASSAKDFPRERWVRDPREQGRGPWEQERDSPPPGAGIPGNRAGALGNREGAPGNRKGTHLLLGQGSPGIGQGSPGIGQGSPGTGQGLLGQGRDPGNRAGTHLSPGQGPMAVSHPQEGHPHRAVDAGAGGGAEAALRGVPGHRW